MYRSAFVHFSIYIKGSDLLFSLFHIVSIQVLLPSLAVTKFLVDEWKQKERIKFYNTSLKHSSWKSIALYSFLNNSFISSYDDLNVKWILFFLIKFLHSLTERVLHCLFSLKNVKFHFFPRKIYLSIFLIAQKVNTDFNGFIIKFSSKTLSDIAFFLLLKCGLMFIIPQFLCYGDGTPSMRAFSNAYLFFCFSIKQINLLICFHLDKHENLITLLLFCWLSTDLAN